MSALAFHFVQEGYPFRILVWLAVWSGVATLLIFCAQLMCTLSRTAAMRSLLWTCCFAVLGVAPIVDWLAPKPIIMRYKPMNDSQPRKVRTPTPLPMGISGSPTAARFTFFEARKESFQTGEGEGNSLLALAAIAMWAGGAGVMLGLIAKSCLQMRRLSDAGVPDDSKAGRKISHLAGCIGIRRRVDVKLTAKLRVPATLGLWRPVILLPYSGMKLLMEPAMRGVLLHELGHIKRWDYLRNLIMHMVTAFFWFLPPAWMARKQLRKEMELACDDFAILMTGDGPGYAKSLGKLVSRTVRSRCPVCSLCLFDTKPTILVRIQSALQPTRRISAVSWFPRILCFFVGSGAVAVFSLTSPGKASNSPEISSAGSGGNHQLVFPKHISLGQLMKPSQKEKNAAWVRVAEAKGNVSFPEGGDFFLKLNEVAARNPSLLAGLEQKGLTGFSVAGIRITASELGRILKRVKLKELDLSNTNLGDEVIPYLKGRETLRKLDLSHTDISEKGFSELKRYLPNCAITLPHYSIQALSRQNKTIEWPETWAAFGPFAKDAPIPDSAALREIPKVMLLGGNSYPGELLKARKNSWLDIESLFGTREEGRTAYLLAEVNMQEDEIVTIWAAADWWMAWYIDGKKVYQTFPGGNQSTDYDYPNHSFKVGLSRGRHVLAVRVASGSKGWGLQTAVLSHSDP